MLAPHRTLSSVLMVAFLLSVLSGCVDAPAPEPSEHAPPPSPVYLTNLTEEVTLPSRASRPCVGLCPVMSGYYHKVADVENTTLLRLDGVVEWEPPQALCDKLVVQVKLVSQKRDDVLYVISGGSPLQFELGNLTIPMMRDDIFLRVVVGNEHYSTPAGDVYANEEITYRLHTTAWLRDHQDSDTYPDLAADEPLITGPTSHCGT